MWIFTTIGFFSAVKVNDDHVEKLKLPEDRGPWVMVRARVKEDATNLLAVWYEQHPKAQAGQGLLVSGEPHEVIQWPGRDYPYRLIMPREHWAQLLEQLAEEIEYPNFKSEVTKIQGHERHNLYGRIWSVMYDAERWLKLEALKARERNRRYRENPPLSFDGDDPGPDDESFGFFGRSLIDDAIRHVRLPKGTTRKRGKRRRGGKKKR